jgi:sterol 3beta-glucosyltransferase
VPTVIIPFFGDQPFWAQRVDKLGVGTKGLHRKTLTADGLTQAIRATADPQMRMRAKALGECIEAENGVQRATEIITRAVQK